MADQATLTRDYEALNAQFESASPQEILTWAVEQFGDRLALVTSLQPTGIITLHMLQTIAPSLSTLILDTGVLFPETYALMDEIETTFNKKLTRVRPGLSLEQQAAQYGEALWSQNPDQCCDLRKTQPLGEALKPFDAWITGLRRDQASTRRQTPIISWDAKNNSVKLAPFATWTEEMVWTWISAYELPYNRLHDQNYPSIGCLPCTRAVQPGEDIRSGRWTGTGKVECGIHISPAS